jgi:MFS family permease
MAATSPPNDSQHTGQTFLYFGSLTLFLYLATPSGFLVDIQTSYMLKNQLHATATQISMFRLTTAIPMYIAFAFGLMRDQWNPFGLRDRGYFLIFAPATAIAFIVLACSTLSYWGLLAGMLLAMLSSRFIAAAYQALIALVGQERLMSGRLSVLWNVVGSVPIITGAFASGYISGHLNPKATFILVAGFTCCIGLLGLCKPRSVFTHTYDRPQAMGSDFVADVKRLLKHRAVYPAVLICFLWNFAPGANTPLQFYLTNTLHASDAVYSYYNGIFAAAFIPTFLLYGFLCKMVALDKLLWWGTIIAVPQMVPLAFIHSANLALALAVPIGLMGGIATAAYYDLAMRSCPPGLQGTLMMLVDGVFALSGRGGDLLGSWIYNSSPRNGFLYCVIAITVVYALILPLILFVPRQLIATADGEANPKVEAEVLEEIAGTETAHAS